MRRLLVTVMVEMEVVETVMAGIPVAQVAAALEVRAAGVWATMVAEPLITLLPLS